ncbi:MAG TPA: AAA family ATPase, partial [Lacipirellulaceae bacterium]|nr:AAA family ATPase [Lacipirellulaceae bacterium]
MADKLLFIVGGPNGAGKTTAAMEFLGSSSNVYEYNGADLIAAEISPLTPAAAKVEAGREFLRRTQTCFVEGRSCLLESTLSGKSLRRTVETAQTLGYRIELRFLFIDSVELSRSRVRQRAAKGGHDVPDADINRRFCRTFRNFWGLYRQLADYWVIYYNALGAAKNVAFGTPQYEFVVHH